MAARSQLIRLAVFGSPIAHSLSPVIHSLFGQQLGLDIDYRAIETGPDEFVPKLRELVLAGGRGCNVTVPLKHLAWHMAKRSSPSAKQAQAANTLLFEDPDDCFADNTDGRGLVNDLSRCWPASLLNCRILIVGAGGAAAGILGDLLLQKPAEVVICNRSPERARRLTERFDFAHGLSSCALDQIEKLGPFELVINATSLGHSGQSPNVPAELFSIGGLCYDLNYGRAAEPLRNYCESRRIRYQDGLGMLVEQAAISFALWTGSRPDANMVLLQLRQNLWQGP